MLLIVSCSKENANESSKDFSNMDYKKLNDYSPAKDVLPDVYHGFKKEVKEFKETEYKSTIDPVDRPVDEAVWLLEAGINGEFGFKNDSIEELFIDTTYFVLSNKSINQEGTPIIDGTELVEKFNELESEISENNNIGHLFWISHLEINAITEYSTVIEMVSAGGPESESLGRLLIPKGPGSELEPFPSNYSDFVGHPYPVPPYPYDYMVYYEYDLWDRIRAPGIFYLDDGWSATYSGHITISQGNGYSNVFWDDGSCNSYTIDATKANQLLPIYKNYIDINNPINNPDLMIGYFETNCWNYSSTTPDPTGATGSIWFQLVVNIDMYNIEYVGLEE